MIKRRSAARLHHRALTIVVLAVVMVVGCLLPASASSRTGRPDDAARTAVGSTGVGPAGQDPPFAAGSSTRAKSSAGPQGPGGVATAEDPTRPPSRRRLLVGVVSNAGLPSAAAAELGAPLVRVEFPIGARPAEIKPYLDTYAHAGSRVLLLAGFHARVPSAEDARNLGIWAAAFGPGSGRRLPVTTIEFGNETSFTYQYNDQPGDHSYTSRAATYAARAATAAAAIRAADRRVGLVVQADDGNTGSSAWVDSMFGAVPDLDEHVVGWTVHPYGPDYRARLQRVRGQLEAHDAGRPFWITEWGVSNDGGRCLSDNYGWDRCMDGAEAAAVLQRVVHDLPRLDVAVFLIYQANDQAPPGAAGDRERYFGVLGHDGRPKPGFTQAVLGLWRR